MSKKGFIVSLGLFAGLAFSSSLLAQPWEKAYGPVAAQDEGHRRVTPVVRCPGRGYIAVGSRDVGGISQVYLVRTSNAGATLWERFFDVNADGQADQGFSLVELRNGSGFVTTGSSQIGLGQVAHVMQVDCSGNLQRSFIYYPPFSTVATRAVGHDIREALVGDGVTTFPGDLLIAGYIEFGGSQADAFLMRLNAGLNLVWNLRYDVGAVERFYGLLETRQAVAGGGDIVAVGDMRQPFTFGSQAIAMRVDGNTGLITGGSHCFAEFGDFGDENFQSAVEMRIAPQTGALTFAGMSTSPGQLEDVYMVQTKDNPCVLLAQATIGNDNGVYVDYATDLIEVLSAVNPALGVPAGSLAMTGYAETQGSVGDAFLLFAQQTALSPLAAFRYGDHLGSVDFGTSLNQIPNSILPGQPKGFIIAGTTLTDWAGVGDPMDLYLIQPNDKASTGCTEKWGPKHEEWPWEVIRHLPDTFDVFVEEEVRTKEGRDDTVVRVCQ